LAVWGAGNKQKERERYRKTNKAHLTIVINIFETAWSAQEGSLLEGGGNSLSHPRGKDDHKKVNSFYKLSLAAPRAKGEKQQNGNRDCSIGKKEEDNLSATPKNQTNRLFRQTIRRGATAK